MGKLPFRIYYTSEQSNTLLTSSYSVRKRARETGSGFSSLPGMICGCWASELVRGAVFPECQQVKFASREVYLFLQSRCAKVY